MNLVKGLHLMLDHHGPKTFRTLFGVWDVLFDADHTRLTLEEIILSEYFHEGASNSTDPILSQVFYGFLALKVHGWQQLVLVLQFQTAVTETLRNRLRNFLRGGSGDAHLGENC